MNFDNKNYDSQSSLPHFDQPLDNSQKVHSEDVSPEIKMDVQNVAHSIIGDQTHAAQNQIQQTAVQLPSKGDVSKITKWLTERSAIGDRGAKKIKEELRQTLQHPETVTLKKGVSNSEVFPWTCDTFKMESGKGRHKRELEGMFFNSTSPNKDINPATNQTILICSGSHLSCENYVLPMVQSLTKMGHDVMIFNYSGFGKSKGSRTEKHIYEDSEAAFDKMCQKAQEKGHSTNINNVKVIGYSLGGAAAAYVGTVRNVDVVLERTFTNMARIVGDQLEDASIPNKAKKMAVDRYTKVTAFNTLDRLEHLNGRCYIVRATEDDMMPKDMHRTFSERIVGLINSKKAEAEKFTIATVIGRHEHHPIGKSILAAMTEPVRGQIENPETIDDLWYGSSNDHDFSREKLDNWLRNNE